MSTVVRFFQEGGPFMIPILLVFGTGIAIAIERWMYLTMSGANNRALWNKIVPFLKAGNFQEAASHTSKSKAAIGSVLTYGLYRIKSARRRDDIEKAMEESLMEVPIAVTAISGEELAEFGMLDITYVEQMSPNTTLKVSRGTNTTLTAFIRGVGQQDPVPGFESGIGIYLDDVYLNRPQAGDIA